MGVYISNMNKPANCRDCPLTYEDKWSGCGCCCITHDSVITGFSGDFRELANPNCPLVNAEYADDFDDEIDI